MARRDLAGKRARRRARERGTRVPRVGSYLIVTEGTKTEPLYFRALADRVLEERAGRFDVREVPSVDISGEGRGTSALVTRAAEIVSRAAVTYQHVWVVFDKDDFPDFDLAIARAEAMGMRAAWSNQSFEYWLYLHFSYSDAALSRQAWVEKLNQEFTSRGIRADGYEKSLEGLYEMVREGEARASRAAKRVRGSYGDVPPSQMDPCTTVDLLVDELAELARGHLTC